MPLAFVHGDITRFPCDAIVNAANSSLLGGGGVDGAIHRAAGPALLAECKTLGGCETGQAKRTGAYNLPAKYIIHTVGPVWHGGNAGEEALLRSCYRSCLQIAAESGCSSIAFPLISAGAYGYPYDAAVQAAETEIRRFLDETDSDMQVTLLFYKRPAADHFPELARWLQAHLNDTQTGTAWKTAGRIRKPTADACTSRRPRHPASAHLSEIACTDAALSEESAVPSSLAAQLHMLDESFSQMLLRKIDESGMTDVECYKKANIDRKLFSKIRSDPQYRPKKVTVLAFALALELSLDETSDFLRKAGYALSRSSAFDVIVEYFISHGEYDVYRINEALFAFDQVLIGA